MQAPGQARYTDESQFGIFREYFLDVIGHFKDDQRVYLWDIYNEPGNSNHGDNSMKLLQQAFEWARLANPSQPISAGVWNLGLRTLSEYQLANSDVVTFHTY